MQEHIVSPAQTTERLQSIQRLIANELGDTLPPDFEGNVLQAIPVQAGGLYPITDVWYIEPGLDIPDRLRVHIAQFANEIAEAASLAGCVVPCNDGIGFKCKPAQEGTSDIGGDVVMLLAALSGQGSIVDMDRFGGVLPRLLHGAGDPAKRLSDTALVKLSGFCGWLDVLSTLKSTAPATDLERGSLSMSSPHPLNQAVIAQALHDLRNGQLRRCKAMGFGEDELDALKHPAQVSVLLNASVSWCSVTINRDVLRRLLMQAQDVEKEIATVDRMLRLGASTEMVSRFYGLTHQEVALRREILGMPKRKGRHPVLDESQDTELWRRWKVLAAQQNPSTNDEASLLRIAMDLSESMALPLSVVWSTIKSWIDQGLV